MKSIKPGRGPSMMSGVMGIFVAVFGVIWTFTALSMGAPLPFALFGIGFIAVAVYGAVYNFRNATGENRYSVYDITEEGEESDPFNDRFGAKTTAENGDSQQRNGKKSKFCPYCGTELAEDFVYCSECGKKLP